MIDAGVLKYFLLANSRPLCYHVFVTKTIESTLRESSIVMNKRKERVYERRAYHAEEQTISEQNRGTDNQRYSTPQVL